MYCLGYFFFFFFFFYMGIYIHEIDTSLLKVNTIDEKKNKYTLQGMIMII